MELKIITNLVETKRNNTKVARTIGVAKKIETCRTIVVRRIRIII